MNDPEYWRSVREDTVKVGNELLDPETGETVVTLSDTDSERFGGGR